jgi:hypothetical protein
MAGRDVHQANPTAGSCGLRIPGQACNQDVLLYRFSPVHTSGPHRDGPDILDGVKARLIISADLNARINGENYLAPLLGKCRKISASNRNKLEKLG